MDVVGIVLLSKSCVGILPKRAVVGTAKPDICPGCIATAGIDPGAKRCVANVPMSAAVGTFDNP